MVCGRVLGVATRGVDDHKGAKPQGGRARRAAYGVFSTLYSAMACVQGGKSGALVQRIDKMSGFLEPNFPRIQKVKEIGAAFRFRVYF